MDICAQNKDMAKRYSNSEKTALLAAYASSGQRLSAYARICGVSVITLRSWQRAAQEVDMGGFAAIERSEPEGLGVFRLVIGHATVSWSGAGNGHLLNVICNGAVRINNLSAGTYTVTVTNVSGFLGTCSFSISNGIAPNCAIFNDPICKQAILNLLEDEAFNTPPECKQWEGDPCSDAGEIYRIGNVGIGTGVGKSGYSLAVKGGIVTDRFRVELCESGLGWCDFVFEDGYPLLSLKDVESYIKAYKHFPGSVTQNYEIIY
jgi:hypothetical protein